MSFPDLIDYWDQDNEIDIERFKLHFETEYCQAPVVTHDGIEVRFRKSNFEHCFFESSGRNGVKDQFSVVRASRIDWIKAALESPDSDLFEGWDNSRKRYDSKRRVCLVQANYIVVIRLKANSKAEFVTAFVADSAYTLLKIKNSPRWTI